MAEIVFMGYACVDCLMLIANGDDSGIEDRDAHLAAMASTNLGALGHVVMACEENCEGFFSTARCDSCGSRLAGERHPIAVLG